jgi:type II restriction enzyme
MDLNFLVNNIEKYKSQSQIARVLTEEWVKKNSYCPNCGNNKLDEFENNRPVADFFCQNCSQEFELKSKNGILGNKIIDGSYESMINRIQSNNNPNFFFLTYNRDNWKVRDFLIIPKHFFVPDFIEKRNPLSVNARRAGWIGCNILLEKIPKSGRVFLVKNSNIINKKVVVNQWKETDFLKDVNQKYKGWLLDILNCIELIPSEVFSIDDVYNFEIELKIKYPNNNFIKDKIRQQLQILRDKGFVKFISRGLYKKQNYDIS